MATVSGSGLQIRMVRAGERAEVVMVAGTSPEAAGEIASVPVAVAGSRIEAELIVGMLRSNGVSAVLSADDAGGQEPQLQLAGFGRTERSDRDVV